MDNAEEHYQVHVTNLDPKLEAYEIIKSLLSSFQQYVKVLYLTVSFQSGVIIQAIIGVLSFREAEYALFELQGEYIGSKRIHVSFVPEEKDIFQNLNSYTPISSSIVDNLNCISPTENNGCFLVYLNPDYYRSEIVDGMTKDQRSQEESELSLSKHLQLLANDMTLLLQEHGEIPLNRFDDLFEKKYGIPVCTDMYNFPDLRSLIEYFKEYFLIRNQQQTCAVCLNKKSPGSLMLGYTSSACKEILM